MSHSYKSLKLFSCLFALFALFADCNPLEAANGRWSAYDYERPAWGGNGGWWGGGHNDWYGDYGAPEEQHYNYYSNYTNPYSPSVGYHYNGYYYNNEYPYGGQHFYDDSVDGGALYLNFR